MFPPVNPGAHDIVDRLKEKKKKIPFIGKRTNWGGSINKN